ncbi:MAG TPA: hypothetical protein VG866_01140, partial [Candidatus Paceibacterota bacterium]|nr:hypothetical protein [Candidatus Paceibacterota bacterium]
MLFFFRSTHRKALIPLLIGIVLLGVAFFVARQKPESPLATATPSGSPQNSAIPSVNVSGWRLYSSQNVGFRMKYDPTLTVDQTQADSIRFSMWGPTQRGQTELYDGISLEVRRVAANSFDDYVNQQMDQFKD